MGELLSRRAEYLPCVKEWPTEVWSLVIGAHPDDIEFMAFSAIEEFRRNSGRKVAGIVCTDGRGSLLTGGSDANSRVELAKVRFREQVEAAELAGYAALAQLGHSSVALLGCDGRKDLVEELVGLIERLKPKVIYIHSLFDKHPTHLAVGAAGFAAVRMLAGKGIRPQRIYGCEVWRGLDWLNDEDKVILDAGEDVEFAQTLYRVFRSQILPGKRYDRAVVGRKFANATFHDPGARDATAMAELAVDLTGLLDVPARDVKGHLMGYVERFRNRICQAIEGLEETWC